MINNLQVLRAFAALLVILYHIVATSKSYGQSAEVFRFAFAWGASSVDMFFVISGFVMAFSQYKRRKPWHEFFIDRVVRIVPIYWLLTTLLLVLYFFVPSLFKQIEPTAMHIVTSYFFLSEVIVEKHPLIYVGWTLEWEMLFYLLFAFALIIKDERKSNIALCVMMVAVAWAFDAYLLLDILMGLIAYWVYQAGLVNKPVAYCSLIIGVVGLLASFPAESQPDYWARVWIWGAPSFFLVLGLLGIPQVKSKFLVYLGTATYSIYLVQAYTISAFYKVTTILVPSMNGDVLAISCLVATVIFGCIVYELVEKPMTPPLRKRSLQMLRKFVPA